MNKFLNLFLSGAVSGGIYAVMAAGVVLTYQTSGIFNFAHGAVAFVTAYVFFQLNTGLDVPVVPSALISVLVFAPLLGLALDRILLRRLAAAPMYARIVGSIGLLIALPALTLWLVEALGNTVLGFDLPTTTGVAGGSSLTVRGIGPFPRETYRLSFIGLDKVTLNSDQVAVFVVAALAATALWIVLRRTRLGLEMRAVVDRRELAGLRGVNASRTSSAAWVLTMMLAGIGGILIAPLFQLADQQFTLIVLGALAAVAFAGLRSIPIAFAGGLLLGILQNVVYGYGDSILPKFLNELAGLRAAIPFILTVVLLFFVGRNRAEARSVSEERAPEDHRLGLPRWRRVLPWVIFLFFFVGFVLQWFPWAWAQASDFESLGILAPGLALSMVFLSFVVVTGLGGMVSLAQGTFVTAGGFMAGWVMNEDLGIDIPFIANHGRINFALAAVMGAIVGAALAAIIAIPVRRLGVLALALASLAIALALDLTLFQIQDVGNGQLGWTYPLPTFDVLGLFTIDFSDPQTEVLAFLVLFGILTLGVHNLTRSASGRTALAVRSSSVAARTSGLAPARSQISLFALGGAIAGFGGVMLGMANGFFTNTSASPISGLLWLAVVVTFGIRRPGGALLAGLAVMASSPIYKGMGDWSFMPGWFHDLTGSTYFPAILFGLGAINLAKNPNGLFALVGSRRQERRRSKDRAAHVELAEQEVHAGANADATATDDDPMHLRAVVGEEFGHVDDLVSTEDAALALDDVVAGYGDVEVLHGVSLHVPKGTVVALLGANGAGKSTLCSVIAGLVTPVGGTITVDGRDVTALEPFQRARAGVMLAPEARGIFPGLTVEENLQVLLRASADRDKAYEIFPILGERRKQTAGLLSGGEQQMLSMVPALVNPPGVFVADEPTLGLAPMAADEIMNAIRRLRDLGSTILLVEEKAHEVLEVADTVAFMELGRLVWLGPTDQIDEERLAGTYLGMTT